MAFGPGSREDPQCPSSLWLCVLSSPHPENRGLWVIPLGKSLNLGTALKQGKEIGLGRVLHKPVSFLPKICSWAEASDPGPVC